MAAPADNQTGIGRSMGCKENKTMSEHIEFKESQDDKQESQHILNINAIGEIANMRDLADKAIETGPRPMSSRRELSPICKDRFTQ